MKNLILSFLAIAVLCSAAVAQEFPNINSAQMKKMIAEKKTVVVDARAESEYRQGHIPTAINIPPERLGEIAKLLPKNKKQTVVFYCRGVG